MHGMQPHVETIRPHGHVVATGGRAVTKYIEGFYLMKASALNNMTSVPLL